MNSQCVFVLTYKGTNFKKFSPENLFSWEVYVIVTASAGDGSVSDTDGCQMSMSLSHAYVLLLPYRSVMMTSVLS